MARPCSLLVSALLAGAIGCGGSPPAAPGALPPPNPGAPAPAPGAPLNLSGAWTGAGTDAQGPETFRWTLTQTDSAVSGTAILEPADPTDGTCGSCHKQKSGVISGQISGNTLTLTLDFPRGGNDLTPLCGLTLTATAVELGAARIAAAYTGSTTCEGPITDGTLVMAR